MDSLVGEHEAEQTSEDGSDGPCSIPSRGVDESSTPPSHMSLKLTCWDDCRYRQLRLLLIGSRYSLRGHAHADLVSDFESAGRGEHLDIGGFES